MHKCCCLKHAVGNCDIDFLNFCHGQVRKLQNFESVQTKPKILESSFVSTESKTESQQKCFKTSPKPSFIPLKFDEMLSVLRNLINYCKISQCLAKFCKSLKDLRKILLK